MKLDDSTLTPANRMQSSTALRHHHSLIASIALNNEVIGTRDVRIRLGVDASAGDGHGWHNDHA